MDNTLPKIIHQLWVGPPLPLHIYQMMQTWKEHHPTWEVKLWTEAPPLVNQDLWDNAEKISPKAPEQFRSDVARYEILYQHGGIWADADFVCQRPFDALARGIFAGQETRQWLNNALIGSPPGHEMLLELIARLPTNVERSNPSAGNTVKSGPQFFTPIARRHKITEYPQRYFYPYRYNQLERGAEAFPDSYSVHHWQNQRRIQGKPFVTV
jgi:mannosyltransferase OCH1-like enzyme